MKNFKLILTGLLLIKSTFALNIYSYQIEKASNNESQNQLLSKILYTNSCKNPSKTATTAKINPSIKNQYNFATLIQANIGQNLNQFKYPENNKVLYITAHSDTVKDNRQLTGKLALVIRDNDRKYKILISNPSGENIQPIAISNAPITSLSWNNTNNSIAYVSYETGKPVVFIQNIYNGRRYIVANFSGSNSSPAFKNNSLLVSLSKDYGTHIYEIDLSRYSSKKTAVPLVTANSIDTEADYANNKLIYTASKNNRPAIFLKSNDDPTPRQISIGLDNTTGRISKDGSKVLYIHRSHGLSDLMYYNLRTGITTKVDSGKILSASFAADNSLIAYIKNNQIVMYNLAFNNKSIINNLKFREILDVRWSR